LAWNDDNVQVERHLYQQPVLNYHDKNPTKRAVPIQRGHYHLIEKQLVLDMIWLKKCPLDV